MLTGRAAPTVPLRTVVGKLSAAFGRLLSMAHKALRAYPNLTIPLMPAGSGGLLQACALANGQSF